MDYGFIQSRADYSLVSLIKDGIEVYMLVYVDDIVIGGNDSATIEKFKDYLHSCFRMKDLGGALFFGY